MTTNNEKDTAKKIDYSQKILQVKNLKTYFKVGTGKARFKVKAVNDISFDVYKREVFGLVGESGCGKTTASRTIIRLYRPTGGEVVFEDTIIGSGHNDFYKKIKYELINFNLEKLKLNPRKKAIYELKESYTPKFAKIEERKNKLKATLEKDINEVNAPVEAYKKMIFEDKNNHNLVLEKALYEYKNEVSELTNQTLNSEQNEYNLILNNLKKAFKIKKAALKDSVGLDESSRKYQEDLLVKKYEKDLAELSEKFVPRIESNSKQIISKEEYKTRLEELKKAYVAKTKGLIQEHNQFLESLNKPNFSNVNQEIKSLNTQYKNDLASINQEFESLRKELNEKISAIDLPNTVDKEKLAELKLKHKEFMAEQRAGILNSKHDHYTQKAKEQVKRMQMIFQDPMSSLNPRMTVGEIISEGLVIAGEKDPELLKSKVIAVLQTVGLSPEYISRYPHEFSGGQRQRIGIARALIMEPTFIIADEPISALDVSIRAQVLNLLTELKEKLDLTILFIAHDLSVVKFFCDRIAVMYSGQIVEMASSVELFSNPLHPYTKSLLSAIPQPDPDSEKLRKRTTYSADMHNYKYDLPSLQEVKPGHFVLCNNAELEEIKKEVKLNA